MTDRELGEVNYNTYRDSRNWTAVNGERIPEWKDQAPDMQASWVEAARVVKERAREGWRQA